MKLCFIVESGTDVRLVEGLDRDYDLTVVTREIAGGPGISQRPERDLNVVRMGPGRLKFAVQSAAYILKNSEGIDFVIVQGYMAAALSVNIACRFKNIPVRMLVCSPIIEYYQCRKYSDIFDKPFRIHELLSLKIMAWLNAVFGEGYIVLSSYLKNVIRRISAKKPVDIVPVYGVDTDIFAPMDEDKDVVKKRSGLPEGDKIVFFSSRVCPEKDHSTLLKAFKMIMEERDDVWLVHRSGGFRIFNKEAEKYGVAAKVISADALHPYKELPIIYQASDVAVQSSLEEGLGFSPLEAMSCGVPVIASRAGGLVENIIDNETGWTFNSGDVEGLVRCLGEALSDDDNLRRLGRNGRKMVLEKFDKKKVFGALKITLDRIYAERKNNSI